MAELVTLITLALSPLLHLMPPVRSRTCWRKEPDFELIDLILNEEPDLLLIADNRGHLPLDYARREHWGLWISYLAVRMKKEIRRRLSL